MNIFFLHRNPQLCVEWYNDQHCVKIILEIAQLLFTALHAHDDPGWQDGFDKVYKPTHSKHPMTLWVTEHPQNFLTALFLGLELCYEYTSRRKRTHKCQALLEHMLRRVPSHPKAVEWKADTVRADAFTNCTPVPLCMPVEYHVYVDGQADLFASYVEYYKQRKLRFDSGRMATWACPIPSVFAEPYAALVAKA